MGFKATIWGGMKLVPSITLPDGPKNVMREQAVKSSTCLVTRMALCPICVPHCALFWLGDKSRLFAGMEMLRRVS